MKKSVLIAVAVLILGAGVAILLGPQERTGNGEGEAEVSKAIADVSKGAAAGEISENGEASVDDDSSEEADSPEDEEEMSKEEKREAEEEKRVEEFDAETDKWMDSGKTQPPTMKEVDAFRELFRKVPKARQDECIHRALNLIPDENVMLLAGILMDKTQDEEIIQTVFSDILNRDEDVKKPVMKEIFKDKTHPCYADAAWILDVTGEISK